jgi:hypothetical protein
MKISISEAELEWMSATLARVVEGLATGGLALPALMAESFAEYMLFVRGATPPAKGSKSVGSVDLSRGRAAINVDLGRAFIVSAKGAALTLVGGALVTRGAGALGRAAVRATQGVTVSAGRRLGAAAGGRIAAGLGRRAGVVTARTLGRAATRGLQAGVNKAAQAGFRAGVKRATREVVSMADEDADTWYQRQRRNGRFRGQVRMEIDAGTFARLRKKYHARVGQLQAGWNAATDRFGMRAPSWISGKSGSGRVDLKRGGGQVSVTAENSTPYANSAQDMRRRIDYATARATEKLERRAKEISEGILTKFFQATP